jgi:hypothetical protein
MAPAMPSLSGNADQGQSHAGVACGGFDNGRALMDEASGFSIENHAQRGAILDTAAGIEELKLGEDGGDRWWCDASQAQHGRRAYELGDVVGNAECGSGGGGSGHAESSLSQTTIGSSSVASELKVFRLPAADRMR